jgi:hypothetical protein
LEKIGNGGFSSVYKVRNLLDNSLYAIKKLKIKFQNKNKDFENEILKVFQEIRFLAKIKGEYIVDYNHSWVEVNLKNEKSKERKKTNLLTEKDLDFKNCEINDCNQRDESDDELFYEVEKRQKFKKPKKKDDLFKKSNNEKQKDTNISSNCFFNFITENKNLELNSNSIIDRNGGNTKTDSSDYSNKSSSKNLSFDGNTQNDSLNDLYGFRKKIEKKRKKEFSDYSQDDEENFNSDNNRNNNRKKKPKHLSMHLPAFEKNNKKKALTQRKSTICIKNKEYLYESFFN